MAEIEETIWMHEVNIGDKPCYTDEGFRAACKIFISAIMDKMWELQDKDDIDIETRQAMATSCGNEIKKLVRVYTDIDTFKMYEE